MKLACEYFLESYEILRDKVNIIAIENPQFYYNIARELQNHNDEFFVLSENEEILRQKDVCDVVTNLFSLDVNSKKLSTLLAKKVEAEYMRGKYFYEYAEISNGIERLLDDVLQEIDLPLEHKTDIPFCELIKPFSVKLKQDDESLLVNIISYINVMLELAGTTLFVLVGLTAFLCVEEIIQLFRHCESNDVCLLLLEPVAKMTGDIVNLRIIDKDLCDF